MLNGGEIRKLLGTNSIHGSIFREKEIYINWKPPHQKKLKWKKSLNHISPYFKEMKSKDNKEIQTEGEEMNISVGFMMFHF